jgi:uncharacterized protein YjbJ (UPF0337 family)
MAQTADEKLQLADGPFLGGFRFAVREQWGKLTDDEVDQIQGNAEILMGKLQERYGYSREQAEQEIERWEGERKAP